MNDRMWYEWLDSLSPAQRDFAQKVMARISALINSDRRQTLDDIQRLERRHAALSERVSEVQQTANAQVDALWGFQLPEAERSDLIAKIHQLVDDVVVLRQAVLGDEESAEGDTEQEANG